MIEEQVKVHDKFSIEIKLGFIARLEKINEFSVSTWFFIPNSLDINRYNYQKSDFYKDLKSNIRLITPVYTLSEMADKSRDPYRFLENSVNVISTGTGKVSSGRLEYHVRMFVSILKSALREENSFILRKSTNNYDTLVENYMKNVRTISANYRELRSKIDKPAFKEGYLKYYLFGDEFMSNLIEQHTFRLLEGLERTKRSNDELAGKLMKLIHDEIDYKKENDYPYIIKDSRKRNRDLIFRLSLLKKYAENELFLNVVRRREGVVTEQVYFSIAAGIAMIFATAVAFSFQRHYGNLTIPFFIALVISYMLKDRLKDLARFYLAHRWGRRFFDTKTSISLDEHKIGWHKEGMDFIGEKKVPAEVLKIRQRSAILEAENRNNQEQIILYRKLVRLNRDSLNKIGQYPTAGMNDIIRFNVSNYIQKMDNPEVPLYVPVDNNRVGVIKGEKIYYLNMIMQFRDKTGVRYKRYRIVMNRKGIREIEKL